MLRLRPSRHRWPWPLQPASGSRLGRSAVGGLGSGASARRKRVGPPRVVGVRPARLWEACCRHAEKRQAELVALPPAHERLKATERRGAGPRRQRRGGVATCGSWWVQRTSNRRIKQLMIKTQKMAHLYWERNFFVAL